MKQVLLIDAPNLFQSFLTDKLEQEQVRVETALGSRDAFTKLITTLPDVIIIDIAEEISDSVQDFLEKKIHDPNAHRIPIIMCGPVFPRSKIATLTQYGVVKYFNKPIKLDVLFESIGSSLKLTFSADKTPCMMDIHVNGNLIFLEIAQGLNRDKLSLLKYKIPAILDKNTLNNPKLVIMITDIRLNFMDGINLELLFDSAIADNRISRKNIKVLSTDNFIKEFLDGHKEYKGIERVSMLSEVLGSLVENQPYYDAPEIIADKVLSYDTSVDQGDIETRFLTDDESGKDKTDQTGLILKVAIVDSDVMVLKLLQSAFSKISAACVLFESGNDFMKAVIAKQNFDLLITEIFLPDMDGFSLLRTLQRHNFDAPIIVYSQISQKEAVIQSLTLGAKTYLVKPQKPLAVVHKAVEILNAKE